ncbi:Peptidase S24/S26A/S26B/S26C family protein [Raphanus sativus]|nr:Peptidase S24/S26A/S26B/S26C family protein [Raphanus sativus]
MAYISNWVRYMAHKLEYSLTLSLKNLVYGRITYLHSVKGAEMAPTMGAHDNNTLLVRKLPDVDTRYVSVGDAVVLKDPNETHKYLVRRLAALEGSEMVSSDEKEEPFVLEKDQCWVVADNQEKSKEAYDSRTFGPVSLADIVGRAIYCMRTAVDHGPVSNSEFSMQEDSPILAVELDVDELAKDHKA